VVSACDELLLSGNVLTAWSVGILSPKIGIYFDNYKDAYL